MEIPLGALLVGLVANLAVLLIVFRYERSVPGRAAQPASDARALAPDPPRATQAPTAVPVFDESPSNPPLAAFAPAAVPVFDEAPLDRPPVAPAPAALPIASLGMSPEPPVLVESLAGLPGAALWQGMVAGETARLVRYSRPVTLLVAELDGLVDLVEVDGAEAATKLELMLGNVLLFEARACDSVAHIGFGRFGVLLPETPEAGASSYASRVRMLCQPGLESAAVPVNLAIGIAGAVPSVPMEIVIMRAEASLLANLRPTRAARRSA